MVNFCLTFFNRARMGLAEHSQNLTQKAFKKNAGVYPLRDLGRLFAGRDGSLMIFGFMDEIGSNIGLGDL